jgi:hypothetical protein
MGFEYSLILRIYPVPTKYQSGNIHGEGAEYWPRRDLPEPLNGTADRRILGQSEMRPDIIVGGVRRTNSTQMRFAEDDDVIEAFPTDRADQPLRMPVLPG